MVRLTAVGAACLTLCLAGPARAQKDTRLVRDGVALHNAGRYEDAIARYAEAYHRNPSLTRLLLLMGASYLNLGRLEEAVDHYERYERAAGARGRDEEQRLQGYFAEAGDKLDEALRRDPSAAGNHLLRARVYLALNKPEAAADAAERFVRLAPPADRGRARPIYERALPLLLARLPAERAPGSAEALLRLSRVYAHLGQAKESALYLARHRALTAPPVVLAPPPPPAPPRRPLWRLLTGSVLLGGGLVTAGFGVSGLAVAGQCVWPLQEGSLLADCTHEYDTRGVGAGLLVGGVAVAAAGALLIALPPRPRAATRR